MQKMQQRLLLWHKKENQKQSVKQTNLKETRKTPKGKSDGVFSDVY